MFGFGKKKRCQGVSASDIETMISKIRYKSDIDKVVSIAGQNGLLTEGLVSRLTGINERLTSQRTAEQNHAQNDGYWSKSAEENVRETRAWNDKCRDKRINDLKSQVGEITNLSDLFTLEQTEKRKAGNFPVDFKVSEIIEGKHGKLMERR